MKITVELLKAMGFEQQKNSNKIFIDVWNLKVSGYLFNLRGGPDSWEFYPPGAYMPYSFQVTDIEELIGFAFKDGYKSGEEGAKKELRKFLGVK